MPANINRKSAALALATSVLCFAGMRSLQSLNEVRTFRYENVLGTSLELKVLTSSDSAAEKAENAALREIDREAKILSAYDPESEFSRWVRTAGTPVKISPELFDVLNQFDLWRERTNGALDASAETIVRVWKKAAAQQRTPSEAELAAAVELVRHKHWTLDPIARTATHLDNAPLALNSFAKSYVIDKAANAALSSGNVRAVVLNIGGDLVVRGDLKQTVNIADPYSDAENSAPIARLQLEHRAVATSGNYRRGVDVDGQHYSHIVDPRTGLTAENIISSTVVSPDPSEAGALATAFSVMTPDESRRLAASRPGVQFLLVTADGKQISSPGWKPLIADAAPVRLVPAVFMKGAAAGTWDRSDELIINLELGQPDAERYRRPYVAVWIEDKDRFPVRTIALWYQKPRWLPELTAWSHDDTLRNMAEGNDIISSVSSAMRPPGQYTLKWDGKDNKGKLVNAGAYTVCIEVAREHGTHQIIRQEMDFNGTPKQIQLPGNAEMAGASLDYRKITNH